MTQKERELPPHGGPAAQRITTPGRQADPGRGALRGAAEVAMAAAPAKPVHPGHRRHRGARAEPRRAAGGWAGTRPRGLWALALSELQVTPREPATSRNTQDCGHSRLSPLPTNDHSAGQNLSPTRAMNLQVTRGDSSAELSLRWRTKNAGDAQSLRRDSTCHRQAREAGSRDVRF